MTAADELLRKNGLSPLREDADDETEEAGKNEDDDASSSGDSGVRTVVIIKMSATLSVAQCPISNLKSL